jgi:hypothetical protein
VRIPNNDRKLLPYAKAMQKIWHPDDYALLAASLDRRNPGFLDRAKREWWLYLATIPLKWITNLEVVSERQPWWLETSDDEDFNHTRAAYLLARQPVEASGEIPHHENPHAG